MKSEYLTFSNGLRVAVAQKANLPITVFYLIVESGSFEDPPGLNGVANLTSDLLDKGAGGMSTFDLAQTLDSLGAHLATSCSPSTSSISLQCLTKDFDKGLEIFSKVVLSPEFPADELERSRAITLSEIEQDKQDPHALIGDLFREALYREHPLHAPVEGYPETLPEINRDHLVAFHKSHYGPANSILVAVSDRPTNEVVRRLESVFGAWSGGDRNSRHPPALPPVEAPYAIVLSMPLTQSFVALGHYGMLRKDPDFNAVRVMNYLLGGGSFSSRLFMGVRNKKGYAYSVSTSISAGRDYPGAFSLSFETQTGKTISALTESLKIIRDVQRTGFKAKELADAKAFFEGSLPRRTQTYGQIASLLADSIYHDLGHEYWLRDLDEILQLKLGSVQEAVKNRISTDRFMLALVGNQEVAEKGLPGIAASRVQVVSDLADLRKRRVNA